ncbi:unnamed protein product, partial [Candidula unifasciata]
MDPAHNNKPLRFNRKKNKPPMPVTRTYSEGRDDDVTSSTSSNQYLMPGTDFGPELGPDPPPGDMIGMYNMMGPMVGSMGGDPNMILMGPMNFNSVSPGPMIGPGPIAGMGPNPMMGPGPLGMMGPGMMGPHMLVKEIIRLNSCVLYPPPPGAPPSSVRVKPPGCRTIFVGGIPENSTSEILHEVFESCGQILSIRISKKNFAHIRFENMESVDRALYISGYRMKINDSDEKEDTGRIHVDYAQAKNDQFEYECLQRAFAREMRHFQRMEEDRLRPPSPPPVTHFSDHEALVLLEKLKSDESFVKASQVLITWLDRGECNRRTSTGFYSMIQHVHGHVRRLTTERTVLRDEFEQYKIQYQQKLQGLGGQLCQVERVLAAAHKQRCWDHFTKAQRKNIDTWQRQAQEQRVSEEQTLPKTDDTTGDDMVFSDDETGESGPPPNKVCKVETLSDSDADENQKLKEENDALKCQMEAFRNEVETVRLEGKAELEEKEKQLRALQNALQGMQQQLIVQRAVVAKLEKENKEIRSKVNDDSESIECQRNFEPAVILCFFHHQQDADNPVSNKDELSVTSSGLSLSDKDAKMI